ncbi:MAG: hypothetical protein LBD06_01170 [Candidatus Accumulibacter sp.]|nr:hypothetical protein [Accumulibacter sp.]
MSETPWNSLRIALLAVALTALLSGCDAIQQQMGIMSPAAKAAHDDADGRAVGGACRQSGRAIEDCYAIYSWLPRASIYEGWRDMDAYMRENNLETIAPQLPPVQPPPPPPRRKGKPASGSGANAAKAAAADKPS